MMSQKEIAARRCGSRKNGVPAARLALFVFCYPHVTPLEQRNFLIDIASWRKYELQTFFYKRVTPPG